MVQGVVNEEFQFAWNNTESEPASYPAEAVSPTVPAFFEISEQQNNGSVETRGKVIVLCPESGLQRFA